MRRKHGGRRPRWRSARRRRWKRSAGSPAASRTTSTTCSPSFSATSTSRCGASGDGKADSSRITRLLDAARQASERAAILVQRLLAFSRQHRWRSRRSTSTGWCKACRSCCAGPSARASSTETVLGGGLWKVAVDPNQLENAHPQPRRQRARRHARRRPADDRNRERPTSTSTMLPRTATRSVDGQYVMLARERHRHRHGARRDRPRLRAVLHHQAGGARHRSRAEHGLRLRQAVGRPHQDL